MRMSPAILFGLLASVISFGAALPATTFDDFSLGANAEHQTCRAQVKFSGPAPGQSVDIYCGAWERPSGSVYLMPPADADAAAALLKQNCEGKSQALSVAGLTNAQQTFCVGEGVAPTRLALSGSSSKGALVGWAYPSDWPSLVRAAEVLTGAAKAQAVTAGGPGGADTPGMAEVRAVYPDGPPGQGAEFNYTLLKRRAYENNLAFNFNASERDFSELLRAHGVVAPTDVDGEGDILAEMGLNQSNGRRFEDAGQTLNTADERAKASGDVLLQSKILNYRAADQINQHNYEAAIGFADQADKLRASASTAARGAFAGGAKSEHTTNSDVRVLLSENIDAEASQRLMVLSAQGHLLAGVALEHLGRSAGEVDGALDAASRSLASGGQPPAWLTAQIAAERARVHLARGDAQGALGITQDALKLVRASSPGTRAEGHLLMIAAQCDDAMGHAAQEREDANAAIAIFTNQRETPGLPPDTAATHLDALLAAWNKDHDAGVAAEYFRTLAVVWDGGAASSAAQLAARLSSNEASGQTRTFQDAERAYRAALAQRERLSLSTPPAGAVAAADKQVEAASKALSSAEAALRTASPRYFELLHPDVTSAALAAVLEPKEGYLRIVQAQDAAYAALVTKDGVFPYRIELTSEQMDKLVAKLRKTTTFSRGRLPDYDLVTAQTLYTQVIAPASEGIKTLERLQIDAGGPLAAAPIAAFVASKPSDDIMAKVADSQDYSGVDWFGRSVALAVSVGPASFESLRKAKPPQQPFSFLAYADFQPSPEVTADRLAVENDLSDHCKAEVRNSLSRLPALPGTAGEATDAAQLFGAAGTVKLGANFTDESFFTDEAVAKASVLLLATHGVLGLSNCFAEPALLTSVGPKGDGLIEASRLLDRRLSARLVIMSACDTAGAAKLDAARTGLTDGGEALSGLARAFLYAGASGVLATQWKVDSDASAKEVKSLLSDALKGEPLSVALAKAQKATYDTPETGHPFYWSGFVLIGDGGARLADGPGEPAQTKAD